MNTRVVIWIACEILTLFWGAQNIVRLVRAVKAAKETGLVKAWFNPRWVIFPIAAVAVFVWLGFGISRMTNSIDNLRRYEVYENLDTFREYVKTNEEKRTGVEVKDVSAVIEKHKTALKNDISAGITANIGRVMFALYLITAGFGGIWLVTDEGLIFCHKKTPEIVPVTAELHDGGIDVMLSNGLVNEKKLVSLKQTPKNMAIFGRFVGWDNEVVQEETETSS